MIKYESYSVERQHHLCQRCKLSVAENSSAKECLDVSFSDDRNCHGDGYRIEVKDKGISVCAGTAVGFNAAVGYLVHHQETGIKSHAVTFESDFRAVYFANHFYNYYHSEPAEELCEYLESLALWGASALVLWFDMHHFHGLNTDDAKAMTDKMTALFQKARSLVMAFQADLCPRPRRRRAPEKRRPSLRGIRCHSR